MRTRVQPERVAEQNNVNYAKKLGYLVRKMNGMGNRHWPDRGYWGPQGAHFFIEYKKVGGKLSPGQELMFDILEKKGHKVFVVSDAEIGRRIISTGGRP